MKKIFLIAILGVLIVNKAQAQLVTKPEKFKGYWIYFSPTWRKPEK